VELRAIRVVEGPAAAGLPRLRHAIPLGVGLDLLAEHLLELCLGDPVFAEQQFADDVEVVVLPAVRGFSRRPEPERALRVDLGFEGAERGFGPLQPIADRLVAPLGGLVPLRWYLQFRREVLEDLLGRSGRGQQYPARRFVAAAMLSRRRESRRKDCR
jgi:hypothetical protein